MWLVVSWSAALVVVALVTTAALSIIPAGDIPIGIPLKVRAGWHELPGMYEKRLSGFWCCV